MAKKYLNITPIRRAGKTIYRARWVLPFDEELGRKPPARDFYGSTMAEADAEREKAKNGSVEPRKGRSNITFVAFLRDEFLPYQHSRTMPNPNGDRPKSFARYDGQRGRLMRYLIDSKVPGVKSCALANAALGSVKQAHVEDWFRLLDAKQACSKNVLRELRMDLAAAFRLAGSKIPDRKSLLDLDDLKSVFVASKASRRENWVFPWRTVLASLQDDSRPLFDRVLVGLIFSTLCRPNEAFALRWEDINFENSDPTITFSKAVRQDHNGKFVASQGTKTNESDAIAVPIYEPLLSLLREYRKERLATGKRANLVLTTKRGKMLTRHNSPDYLKGALASLGLQTDLDFYKLKHSGNSFLASQGVSVELRCRLARWTDGRMATKTYRSIDDVELRGVGQIVIDAMRSVSAG